jgi:hypothetical protein
MTMTFHQIAEREVHVRNIDLLYDVALLLSIILITLAVVLA